MHRVYCTYFEDGRYYIGYSSKPDRLFAKYYGSNQTVKNYQGQLRKEVIGVYATKSHARAVEHMLQWQYRLDPLCINDMWNVRLKLSNLKTLTIPNWSPR